MSDTPNLTRFGRFVRVFSGDPVPTTLGSLLSMIAAVGMVFFTSLMAVLVGLILVCASLEGNTPNSGTLCLIFGALCILAGMFMPLVVFAHNKPVSALLRILHQGLLLVAQPLRVVHKPLLGLGGSIQRGFARISTIKVGVQHRP